MNKSLNCIVCICILHNNYWLLIEKCGHFSLSKYQLWCRYYHENNFQLKFQMSLTIFLGCIMTKFQPSACWLLPLLIFSARKLFKSFDVFSHDDLYELLSLRKWKRRQRTNWIHHILSFDQTIFETINRCHTS